MSLSNATILTESLNQCLCKPINRCNRN